MNSQLPRSILKNSSATSSRIPRPILKPIGRSVGFSSVTDTEQDDDDKSAVIYNRFSSIRSPAPSSFSRHTSSSSSGGSENPFDRYSRTLADLSTSQVEADFAQREYRLARQKEWEMRHAEESLFSQILSSRNDWISQRYGSSASTSIPTADSSLFSSATSFSRPYTTTSLGLPTRSISTTSSSARSPSGYVISDGGFSYAPNSTGTHRTNDYFSSGTSLTGLGRPLSAPARSYYSSYHDQNNCAWSNSSSSVVSSIVSELSRALSQSGVNISRVSLAPDGSVEMTVTRSSNSNTSDDRSGFFPSLFGRSRSGSSDSDSSGSGSSYESSTSGNGSRPSSWWTG